MKPPPPPVSSSNLRALGSLVHRIDLPALLRPRGRMTGSALDLRASVLSHFGSRLCTRASLPSVNLNSGVLFAMASTSACTADCPSVGDLPIGCDVELYGSLCEGDDECGSPTWDDWWGMGWYATRPPDAVFWDRALQIQEDGLKVQCSFPESTTCCKMVVKLLSTDENPLMNEFGNEIAADMGWDLHVSVTRPSWLAHDHLVSELWAGLCSRWEGAIVQLPVWYVSESAVAYLSYRPDRRTELIDDLWAVHSKGPWRNRCMHVSM